MYHYNRRTLGLARVKAHAIYPQQLKQLNRLIIAGFAVLSSFALVSSFFNL